MAQQHISGLLRDHPIPSDYVTAPTVTRPRPGAAAQAADDARIAAYLGGADTLARWLGGAQWLLLAGAALILLAWSLRLLPGTTTIGF